MKITILDGTTKNPLQTIGHRAGICWGGDTDDETKNISRAVDCIQSGHGRVLEFVGIEFAVEGISARAARELYTHIGGSPTRLQSSTRYIDYGDFGYYNPVGTPGEACENASTLNVIYREAMNSIAIYHRKLLEAGMSREDAANILPLGMETKVVMRTNLRMVENLMNQRLCTRAYKEMRLFAMELKLSLSRIDGEWKQISDNLLICKCQEAGYCTEKKGCGLARRRDNTWYRGSK